MMIWRLKWLISMTPSPASPAAWPLPIITVTVTPISGEGAFDDIDVGPGGPAPGVLTACGGAGWQPGNTGRAEMIYNECR